MSPAYARNAIILLWLILVVAGLAVRPPFPVDETRYLSVAWEMWLRGDFLVPYFNGEPYTHKPPLLFWLIHMGWQLGGVNDISPRLIAPLFALLNLFLIARIGRRLWPHRPETGWVAALLVAASWLWASLFTLLQFDMLLVCFVLLALLGIFEAAAGHRRGWFLTGAALGLGILAKGPVVFLHVLPLALLAPAWRQHNPPKWLRWYVDIGLSLVLSGIIGLAWAWPAAQSGGEAYQQAIFWGQYADRVSADTMIHHWPWWFYLAWLPLVLLPWSIWQPAWSAMRRSHVWGTDHGVRICVIWFAATLLLFTLMGSKHVKYLLPAVPAAALLLANGLLKKSDDQTYRIRAQAFLLVLTGVVMVMIPVLSGPVRLPVWASQVSPVWGGLLILAGTGAFFLRPMPLNRVLAGSAASSGILFMVIHLGLLPAGLPAYDLAPLAKKIAALQAQGSSVANAAKYHNQYQYLGRLEKPIEVVVEPSQALNWSAAHPDEYILVYYKKFFGTVEGVQYQQLYRGGSVVIWQGKDLVADPGRLRPPSQNRT